MRHRLTYEPLLDYTIWFILSGVLTLIELVFMMFNEARRSMPSIST